MKTIDELILKVRKDVQACKDNNGNCNKCEFALNGQCEGCYGLFTPSEFYEHLCFITERTDTIYGIGGNYND